ncbi:MAG: terminase large subunit [Oscillospiraceae bacterium]|jgi:phage terminase large subunit-like protein|nr:terminase large subunit [Oscillospiraceae bacterium]
MKNFKPSKFMLSTSHYDKEKADHSVNFIEQLRHTKGKWAGSKFKLLPWQETIVRDIFGVIKENGCRQFNTAFVTTPKKAGKSELAAAIALYMLCADGEQAAEVYGCANDRQQSCIVFNVARDMVLRCPALLKRVKILESQKKIVYLPTRSIYQALSSDVATKFGLNVSCCVFDELLGQPDRKLFDTMTKGSGAARTQSLNFVITTAGSDIHSICYEVYSKAKDILKGRKTDPSFYPAIFGASKDADWTNPKTWRKAHPSLGVTVTEDFLRQMCESAKQNPTEENQYRQFFLNQWCKQSIRWMPMDKWDACHFIVNEKELEGRVCYGGLDLSSTTDITAFVLVFPPTDADDKYSVLPYFWIPEENINLRVRRDHVPYDIWQKQGFLLTTEGNVVHYGFIEELGGKYNRPVRKFYRLQSKSTTAYEDTSREILMQSHFLSDAFFDNLRSVKFTDRSIVNL